MKSVTMKFIADEMGISTVSVSKALSGQRGVSEALRGKIVRRAQELGYIYAGVPVAVNAKSPGDVGILVADRFFNDNSFYSYMHRSVVLECLGAGVSCLLEIVSPQNETNTTPATLIAENKCGGIIIMGELSVSYIDMVRQLGVPYILLDFYHDEQPDDCVISDGLSGTFRLTNYLVKLGYRKIGFVGSPLATSSILDRYLGYVKGLVTNRLRLRDDWVIPDRNEHGVFIDFSFPSEMPEAFVCNCDEVAYHLVKKLKSTGYRIPEDMAVVGFDDFRFAGLSNPTLTTHHVNVESMAKVAVSRLMRKMAGRSYTMGCSVISGDMIVSESTPSYQR